MKISVKLLLFSFLIPFIDINAQNFQGEFNDAMSSNDTAVQRSVLKKWELSNNNDPELYVSYFNFYANLSKQEMLTMGDNPQGENVLEISDSNSTEAIGYIYGETYYNTEVLNKGFYYIDKGIEKFPNRLDMRFGKTYMYGELKDYENYTKEIKTAIKYSKINDNKWLWSFGKELDDPEDFFFGNIQNYQIQLYNTGNDSLLFNMKEIAETILKYYPNDVVSLSNISIVHVVFKEYDESIKMLKIAESIDPKDYIVLSNIANAYKLKGDNKNAIKYYKLTEKYGDDRAKKHAIQMIEELKNN